MAAGRIDSEHALPCIDVGREGDEPYFVYPWSAGRLLAEFSPGKLSPAQIVSLIGQACEALHAAREQGLLHLCLDGDVMLVDRSRQGTLRLRLFGFGEHHVRPEDFRARYRAPEQLRGKPPDHRADLWSIGVLLYELLSGEAPFSDDDADRLRLHIITRPVRPLRRHRDVSLELATVVERCLAKAPEDRPRDAQELRLALASVPEARISGFRRTDTSCDDRPDSARSVVSEPRARSGFAGLPADDVQLTVYRPRQLRPQQWYDLLAYVHLAQRRPDASESAPDPIEEVRRRVEVALGEQRDAYRGTTQDALLQLPRIGEVTLVPDFENVECNPRQRSFLWCEDVHEERFRLRVDAGADGQTIHGHLRAYLGLLLLAEVPIALNVDSAAALAAAATTTDQARVLRNVFVSYCHDDAGVVQFFGELARGLGFKYLVDTDELRSGMVWNEQLRQMIRGADAFQLFWSARSMRSAYCRAEWEYALSLGRAGFVRPVYWEVPMPRDDAASLPPPELARLHFSRLAIRAESLPLADAQAGPSTQELATLPPAALNDSPVRFPVTPRTDVSVARTGSQPPLPRERTELIRWSGVAAMVVVLAGVFIGVMQRDDLVAVDPFPPQSGTGVAPSSSLVTTTPDGHPTVRLPATSEPAPRIRPLDRYRATWSECQCRWVSRL